MRANAPAPIEKIQTLPADRLDEVEDFEDFIRLREHKCPLTHDAAASARAFAAIWNNPEDDVCDAL
jgi:hypothetical protein